MLGLGAAAAWLTPALQLSPRGEPLLVASGPDLLIPAGAQSSDCASFRNLAAGARLASLGPAAESQSLVLETLRPGAALPDDRVVVLIDRTGHVLAGGRDVEALRHDLMRRTLESCGKAADWPRARI